MITNEREIRIALQAMLACALAFYGLWGCASVVVLLMLPWRPLLAAGLYLVQPIVDWRVRKTRVRHEKGIAQLEGELEVMLPEPRGSLRPAAEANLTKPDPPLELPAAPRGLEPLRVNAAARTSLKEIPETACDLSAALAIPPAIRTHLQALPQGVFSNMVLEVEAVTFHEEIAEATVRFHSSSVSGLVIRRRYLLRKRNGQWQVESRQPANGTNHAADAPKPSEPPSLQL